MNQPLARVTALQYRNIAVQPGGHPTMPVLRVHLHTHEDAHDHHDLPNGDWGVQNAALQFMAKWGWQPSALDGTMARVRDDQVLVPIAPSGENMPGDWGLSQSALHGAQEALENAEWFDPDPGVDGDSAPHSAAHGGGGPDPGTGNRGGVDHESEDEGVTAELADEDSDAGINVTIS